MGEDNDTDKRVAEALEHIAVVLSSIDWRLAELTKRAK